MLDTELCACGSGLRRVRCCGADPAALPDAAALAQLDEAGAEATRLYNEKKTAEAEALALKLLDLAPNHRLPLRVLFEVRRAETKMKAAEVLARRLADLPGANAQVESAANLQLAQLIIGRGRFADAEVAARKALIATPRDVTVHHVMGVVLTETGRAKAGERHYRRALELLGRDDGMVLANTAWNLKLQGRLEEAAALYQRALALRPDNIRAVGGHAQVEMARGNRAKAVSLLDDGLARWPADRTLRLLRVFVDIAGGHGQAVLDRLNDKPETLLPAELSARGQALALLDRPVEAVSHFALGKKLQRERYGNAYAPQEFSDKSKSYKSFFTSDRFSAVPRAGRGDALKPVFLLGFPHSGTSVLEQMLALAPGFAPGDDLFPLQELIDLLPNLAGVPGDAYPELLTGLMIGDGQEVPEMVKLRYQALRREAGLGSPDRPFVTDRGAALHWHLGLIKLLFPEAPIIHMLRHPFDLMLSNIAQERKLEANCGVSMEALARHYDLTMSMIRHYRGQLTLRYMPVRYEDLVTAPAATIAAVAAFVGAPAPGLSDDRLRANDATAAPTPAHFAWREKVHTRGLYRWRAYQAAMPDLFTAVRPLLDPWISELGYGDLA